jgi:hypothetical protein
VHTNRNRNRQRLLSLQRPLHKQPHVVRRDDVDAGERLFLDDETIDTGIDAKLRIARDNHARSDHRPAIVDRRHRNRQLVEIDVVANHGDFAGR